MVLVDFTPPPASLINGEGDPMSSVLLSNQVHTISRMIEALEYERDRLQDNDPRTQELITGLEELRSAAESAGARRIPSGVRMSDAKTGEQEKLLLQEAYDELAACSRDISSEHRQVRSDLLEEISERFGLVV